MSQWSVPGGGAGRSGAVPSWLWPTLPHQQWMWQAQCVCVLYLHSLCYFCVGIHNLCVCLYLSVFVIYGVIWLPELVISECTAVYRYTSDVPCNSCVLHALCMCLAMQVLIDVSRDWANLCMYECLKLSTYIVQSIWMLVFKPHVWYSAMIHSLICFRTSCCFMYHLFATVMVSVTYMRYIQYIAVEYFMGVLKSPKRFRNPPPGLFG